VADGAPARSCSYCGGESDGTKCTLWAFCPGEIDHDASVIICNDAPHELDCSCTTGTCKCSSGKTVPMTTCACDGLHLGDSAIIDPLVAACAF